MKLSEHLDLAEVIRSETAKRQGISNMPTEEHIANFKLLAENVFEKIRNLKYLTYYSIFSKKTMKQNQKKTLAKKRT